MLIANDLIEIITYYTISPITYLVITLDKSLVGRLAYSAGSSVNPWRNKVLVERRGVIDNNFVTKIHKGSYHAHYRYINSYDHNLATYTARHARCIRACNIERSFTTDGMTGVLCAAWCVITAHRYGISIFDVRDNNNRHDYSILNVVRMVYVSSVCFVITEKGIVYALIEPRIYEEPIPCPIPVIDVISHDHRFCYIGRDGRKYAEDASGKISLQD